MCLYSYSLSLFGDGFWDESKNVHYLMPYMPISSNSENNWDSEDQEHCNFVSYSKKIYNSKYNKTNAHYYLFKDDLQNGINKFVNKFNFDFVIPVASTHPLSNAFAEHIATKKRVEVVDCLNKISKGSFEFDDNISFPEGKILIVDDVVTSGTTLTNVLSTIRANNTLLLSDIHILCIGKTERDFVAWDEKKQIEN